MENLHIILFVGLHSTTLKKPDNKYNKEVVSKKPTRSVVGFFYDQQLYFLRVVPDMRTNFIFLFN
jgi:hypothetical protein